MTKSVVSLGQQSVAGPLRPTSIVDLDQNVLTIGEAMFAMRRARTFYLDDHVSTDGAFSTLLAMFLDTARGEATPIERIVTVADVPLSTAMFILNILIESGQIRRYDLAGQESYMLTVQAEQAMYRYLSDSLEKFRHASRLIH